MAGGIKRSRTPDLALARAGIRDFLVGLGFEVDAGALSETPGRVVDAYAEELLAGYDGSLGDIIRDGSEPCDRQLDPVLLRNVAVAMVCPHHLLVAEGKAHIAYEPGERLLGLGTLVRLVQVASRRLAFQEEVAGQLVDALMILAGARGAFCRIELEHSCLRHRGSREADAIAVSAESRGSLADPARLMLLLGPGGDSVVGGDEASARRG